MIPSETWGTLMQHLDYHDIKHQPLFAGQPVVVKCGGWWRDDGAQTGRERGVHAGCE